MCHCQNTRNLHIEYCVSITVKAPLSRHPLEAEEVESFLLMGSIGYLGREFEWAFFKAAI